MAVASVCLAVFFSWLTFLVSGCCLLAPFWMFADSLVSMSVGLYLRCLNPYENSLQDCDWIDITNEIGWHQACAGMWTGGVVTMLACAFGALFMCCSCCRGRGCATLLTIGAFFAAGLFISTVLLWAVKNGNLFDRGGLEYYDWGYYLSCGTAFISIITSIVFSCTIYQIGRIESMY